MNVAKIALMIIITLLVVVIFFALTGLDVRNPMPAVERIIVWMGEFNRTVNARLRAFFYNIRIRLFGGATGSLQVDQGSGQPVRPLAGFGQAINNLFSGMFGGLRDDSEREFIEPINP